MVLMYFVKIVTIGTQYKTEQGTTQYKTLVQTF